jgi:hypothetical protein
MRVLRSWLGALGTLALAGLPTRAGAQPLGSEFQVNAYTTGRQEACSRGGGSLVAADASGNFVVVWQNDGPGDTSYGIFGRRFDSNGKPLGAEFRVNSYTTGRQWHPAVAADASGDFVVAWTTQASQDGSAEGVFAQRYDSAGEALGGEFRVNSYTTSDQRDPSVATDGSGNFVIVWSSRYQDGDRWGIFGQRYDSDGSRVGREFRVNTSTPNDQRFPSVTAAADGDFVVAWLSGGIDAQRYDSAGQPQGGEFRVNDFGTFLLDPTVATDVAGNFVVVWRRNSDVFAKRYDNSGGELGGEFLVGRGGGGPVKPHVASDADGEFLVVWTDAEYPDAEVAGRHFSGNGEARGDKFQVNVFTGGSSQECASVGSTGAGQFVVVWQSGGDQDGDSTGVFGRRFDLGQGLGVLDGSAAAH